jgi:hypothetical protein
LEEDKTQEKRPVDILDVVMVVFIWWLQFIMQPVRNYPSCEVSSALLTSRNKYA